MTEREKLKKIILELSYEKRLVTLASGRQSDFYFDGKQTTLHSEGGYLTGKLFYEAIRDVEGVQAVGDELSQGDEREGAGEEEGDDRQAHTLDHGRTFGEIEVQQPEVLRDRVRRERDPAEQRGRSPQKQQTRRPEPKE